MTEDLLNLPTQQTGSPGEAPTDVLSVPTQPVVIPLEMTVDVLCPSCGRTAHIDAARRSADGFCPTCDFPLFWAVERVPLPTGDALGDTGLRRLPGTVGRASLAALACPGCTEPNAPSATLCVRCGAELRPTAVVAAPAVTEVLELPVEVRRPWWIAVLVGFLVLSTIAGIWVLLYL